MPMSYNLRVGTPDTTNDAPAHISGTRQGNSPPTTDPGIQKVDGGRLRVTARRSTGINPDARNPITPGAPNLSPA
jgi:hypothetical protein